jgi:hypothetical protein
VVAVYEPGDCSMSKGLTIEASKLVGKALRYLNGSSFQDSAQAALACLRRAMRYTRSCKAVAASELLKMAC